MGKIRTLVADDDPQIRRAVSLLLHTDADLEVVGDCGDGRAALAQIRALVPELLILDIRMPGLDGFDVLAALDPGERPVVLLTTAFEEHALRAFEAGVVDYLVKPYTAARLRVALDRAKRLLRRPETTGVDKKLEELLDYVRRREPTELPVSDRLVSFAPAPANRIVFKTAGALHFVDPHEVIWIEAQGDFIKVQTLQKTQLVRQTLQGIERKLDPAKFLRIHRSFLVNLDHVRRVETALYGDYSVFMSDGMKLRLSRNYRAKLKTLLRPLAM